MHYLLDCAILIRGETGTGKEVIAKAIHDTSPRRQNRFVALNCAAFQAPYWRANYLGMNGVLSLEL